MADANCLTIAISTKVLPKMQLRPMRRPAQLLVALLTILPLISGCATTPLPMLQDEVPPDWQRAAAELHEWPNPDWWNNFGSDELAEIITLLENSNLDLQNSERALRNAQLLLEDAGFDLLPVPLVDLGGGVRYAGSEQMGGDYSGQTSESVDLSVAISYTDILSKPLRYDASRAGYDSSLAQAADVRLNIYGTAASTYFRILLLRDRIEAAMLNLENAERIARIVQARVDAGVVPPIDALQQQIAVQRQRNAISSLRQDEFQARSALALLLARSGRDFDVRATTLSNLVTPEVAPGIPSQLLARRPDLVRSEASLRAAHANLGIARRSLLPTISLTSSANRASDSLSNFLDGANLGVSVSSALVQSIFDAGRRTRALERQQLAYESLIADYRQAIIRAFNDIEVALGNITLLESLGRIALEDLARASESLRIAEVRYREGVDDYQTVLNSQNVLYSARNAVLDNKLAHLNAVVSMYQALGGGWQMRYED